MLSACKGEPCDPATVSTSLEVDLVSELTGSKVIASVERSTERRGRGQYVIRYQPTVKGRHQLHIKADGQHIRGSPFSVTVKRPVEKLGTPIQTWGGFKQSFGSSCQWEGGSGGD